MRDGCHPANLPPASGRGLEPLGARHPLSSCGQEFATSPCDDEHSTRRLPGFNEASVIYRGIPESSLYNERANISFNDASVIYRGIYPQAQATTQIPYEASMRPR